MRRLSVDGPCLRIPHPALTPPHRNAGSAAEALASPAYHAADARETTRLAVIERAMKMSEFAAEMGPEEFYEPRDPDEDRAFVYVAVPTTPVVDNLRPYRIRLTLEDDTTRFYPDRFPTMFAAQWELVNMINSRPEGYFLNGKRVVSAVIRALFT